METTSKTEEFKPATRGGKEYALKKLAERVEKNKNRTPEDIERMNSELHAGSPVYFPCVRCGELIEVPENYIDPPTPICDECEALKVLGWLE